MIGAEADTETRRVLVTGLSTYWGGRLAQALEGFEQIEAIIGVDSREPRRELERTEFVKVSNQHSLIQRIVRAAEIDTVIDTRLVVDSLAMPPRAAHDGNRQERQVWQDDPAQQPVAERRAISVDAGSRSGRAFEGNGVLHDPGVGHGAI